MAGMSNIKLEITCADVAAFLGKLSDAGITLEKIVYLDDLSIEFIIKGSQLAAVANIAEKCGAKLNQTAKNGFLWFFFSVLRRPLLVIGLLMLLIGFWLLPGRIFILEVEGNTSVPSMLILEAAENCGIHFGVSAREVRSEKMKNGLLHQLPQLQWAGINTYGCRAVITVRERRQEISKNHEVGVSSIVAGVDGVIISCTATRGNCLVQPGQAVQAGQVLISGYTDLGLCISATEAEGEIYAKTKHVLSAKTPSEMIVRTEKRGSNTKYSLIIGKKRINFYKGSGISDASCVKMYLKYVLTLPGGFLLPVSLIKETETIAIPEKGIRSEAAVREQLSSFCSTYLKQVMIGGNITGRDEVFILEDGCTLVGQYQCQEMIGRVKPEEIGDYHETD